MSKATYQPFEPLELSVDVLVDHIIAEHSGDAVDAVRTLVLELDFTRDQLSIASRLLSSGIGRGWKPQMERMPSTPEA
jgi:hypothetical protein